MYTQIIYGTANTIYFPMLVADGTDFAVAADWTPVQADAYYTIDGGTRTICSGTIAIAVSGAAIWKLALSAAECTGTTISIAIIDSATKAVEDQAIICSTQFSGQLESNKGINIGEVDTATFTATATAFEAFRIAPNVTEETTAEHYKGRNVLFTSGVLTGQMSDITAYALANSKEKFTVTSMTEAPGDADRFVVL